MHRFLFVGTFDSRDIYRKALLRYDEQEKELVIAERFDARGSHSWLAFNQDKSRLYATCWSDPPGIAAYSITKNANYPLLSFLNFQETASRSGYVVASETAVYSAGGASGETFFLDENGALQPAAQRLSFVDAENQQKAESGQVLDFGGLRHGAHSADLSPDGKTLYVADIGRNCIWTMDVQQDGNATNRKKFPATRKHDGPRHVWPHPNGKIVYSLQEHSSMVDAFAWNEDRELEWQQGVRIIPSDLSEKLFWADEVRLSLSNGDHPQTLFASTRGLTNETKGYVSAFALLPNGLFESETAIHLFETSTSGGWANAIEPAPDCPAAAQLVSLTDSEEGLVSVLKFDGKVFTEQARLKLPRGGAATALWYS